jgi:hypothetical protein
MITGLEEKKGGTRRLDSDSKQFHKTISLLDSDSEQFQLDTRLVSADDSAIRDTRKTS